MGREKERRRDEEGPPKHGRVQQRGRVTYYFFAYEYAKNEQSKHGYDTSHKRKERID